MIEKNLLQKPMIRIGQNWKENVFYKVPVSSEKSSRNHASVATQFSYLLKRDIIYLLLIIFCMIIRLDGIFLILPIYIFRKRFICFHPKGGRIMILNLWYDIWHINYAIWTSKISPIGDIMKCTWTNFDWNRIHLMDITKSLQRL